jgi:glutathione-regulated potassium-efflux system ancillary protein KefC
MTSEDAEGFVLRAAIVGRLVGVAVAAFNPFGSPSRCSTPSSWIAVAFAAGVVARQVGLPPLVGYLVAGFGCTASAPARPADRLKLSELGVTLLLFTIGLKLKLKSLARRPHVWGVASLHMVAAWCGVRAAAARLRASSGCRTSTTMDVGPALVLAFALSFSSTVFAVKVLEEKGEMGSLYGTIAIGILIMQDLAAVLFLAVLRRQGADSLGAAAARAAVPLRPLLGWLLDRAGHGELLLLFGLTLGIGGAELFELCKVKGDLGALLLGVLIAPHAKSGELCEDAAGAEGPVPGRLLPQHRAGRVRQGYDAVVALLLVALLLFKGFLFEQLLLGSGCGRARPSGRADAVQLQRVRAHRRRGGRQERLAAGLARIIAMVLALSFVVASPLNAQSHALYELFSRRLRRQERAAHPVEREIDPGDADVMVVGMGRVGRGAYDTLVQDQGLRPVGIDADPDAVAEACRAGRNVVQGSATDADFWQRLHLDDGHIKLVLLAMPQASENVFAAEHLRKEGFEGTIGAIAKFPDDEEGLRAAGVHARCSTSTPRPAPGLPRAWPAAARTE